MELKKSATSQRKVHVILWCIAAFTLMMGIMNLHSSFVIRDYRCLEGEIVNLEECQVLQRSGFVTRYNYTIVWYDEGVRYEKSVHEAIDRPDVSLTKVWVNANNTDAILGESSSARSSAYMDFFIAILTLILGIVFMPRGNKKSRMSAESMESMYYMAILMAVLMLLGNLFMLYLYCNTSSRHIYVTPVFWDLAGIFTIVFAISIVIIVKLHKRLNEAHK